MDETVADRPAGDRADDEVHPALAAIARLAAAWRLPRAMEDEPASHARLLEQLAPGKGR